MPEAWRWYDIASLLFSPTLFSFSDIVFFVYVLQVRSSDVTVVVYAGFFFLFINNVYKQSLLGCVITMVRKYQEAM